jgi:glycosyltransferase involved in cell wall biosynthesis
MNIVLLATSYPTQTGGIGAYVERLAEGLTSKGHEVEVAVRAESGLRRSRRTNDELSFRVWWDATPRDLLRLIRGSDVTHMNGFWLLPATLAITTRKPLLWTHHEYDTTCPIGIGWYRDQSTSFAARRCITCMAARGMATKIPRRFGLLPVRRAVAQLARVNLVPSAYMAARLALPRTLVVQHGTEETKSAQPPASRRPIFLFLGRLVHEKGCDVLLEAAHLCRNAGVEVLVEICGDGPERPALENEVRARRLESIVSFSGSIEKADVPKKFAQARAVVVPSRWDEVAGIVALESMAAGVPVIASRVGGLAEMVHGGGLLVERESPGALASAMITLARDSSQASALGRQAHSRHRRQFNLERMIRDHERVYDQVRRQGVTQQLANAYQGSL